MSKIARFSSSGGSSGSRQPSAIKPPSSSSKLPPTSGGSKTKIHQNGAVAGSNASSEGIVSSTNSKTSSYSSSLSNGKASAGAVRNPGRRLYVEREFAPRSKSPATNLHQESPSSPQKPIFSPRGLRSPRPVTSRSKTPSKLTTFGKNISRESSPETPESHSNISGNSRIPPCNLGIARRSPSTHHQSLQKRNSFESETQSSSDYYEDVKILSIRNQIRPKHHASSLLSKARYSRSMETSSDYQSESDIYDDVGIPGLRQNAYKSPRPKLYGSPIDMSCESQSESDSHNYEEITEAVLSMAPAPHNYEEIDEFSSDDDYDDYDDYCLERSVRVITPDVEAVECCEPAEQQQIYTDWANHYLEKSRYKRCITDLQADICDGVLLGDIVHAVTNQKVQDIISKPKNATQMIENISNCLTFLASVGVAVDGLNAADIREGNLKAILGLFFSLSRYKQQQKAASHAGQLTEGTQSSPQLTDVNANSTPHSTDMLSRLPFSKTSKCPTVSHPSAVSDKKTTGGSSAGNINRVGRGTGHDTSSRSQLVPPGSRVGSRDSSRSTSPSTSLSGIPTPGSRAAAAAGKVQEVRGRGTHSSSNITTPTAARGSAASIRSSSASEVNKNNSMLDKFKFFKDKGKSGTTKGAAKTGAASKAGVKDGSKTLPSQSGAAARLADSTAISPPSQGSPKLPQKGLKKPSAKSKKDGGLSPTDTNSLAYSSQRASGSSSSIPSRTSSTTSINSSAGGSIGKRSIPVSKDGSSSASRIGGVAGVKPKAASASYSAMPTAGTGIPKPGSKPPKASSLSEPTSIQQPAKPKTATIGGSSGRKTSGQSKVHGQSHKPPPTHPPPPTPQPTVPSVPSPSVDSKIQATSLSSASSPGLRHSQSKHPPAPPPPSAEERELKSNNISNASCPDNVYTSVAPPKQAVTQQKLHQPVQRSASVGSQGKPPHPPNPRQGNSNQPTGGALYSASYACISPSKSQFPTIPEEPPPKPKKVDCDTQTTVSAVASAKQIQSNLVSASMPHLRLATAQNLQVKKSRSRSTKTGHSKSESSQLASPQAGVNKQLEQQSSMPPIMEQAPPPITSSQLPTTSNSSINHSDSNMSTASESNVSSSSSKSNSGNNSASSTDSVIYRPSSCDELESDSNTPKSPLIKPRPSLPSSLPTTPAQPLDHISSLRRKQQEQQQRQLQQQQQQTKKETTFNGEVTTEARNQISSSSGSDHKDGGRKESTGEDGDSGDMEIKPMQPMQPIMRSTPYSFLRGGNGQQSSPFNHNEPPTSRMGNNRPLIDPTKLYTSAMRRNTHAGMHEGDYSSDMEGFDVTAGYMSDGDILRSNQSDDRNCGYMSEGGASLYAKRLQQRFREGMMAVKECMQKSAAMVDDDSFEDSSSISSGDISDTINDISTDEISTGSSLTGTSSERTNPYGSLKRGPATTQDAQALFSRSLPSRSGSSYLANNKGNFEAGGINWKKYAIGGENGPGPRPHGYQSAIAAVRKSSQAIVTDLRSRSGTAIAIDDPSMLDGDHKGHKVNSETNTDRSVIMIRRNPNGQPVPFAMRRPSAPTAGERLSNYRGMVFPSRQLNGKAMTPGGAIYMNVTPSQTDMGPEAYNASTLERKKKALAAQEQAAAGGNPATSHNGPQDFNSLGRRKTGENMKEKLFGSRSSLSATNSGSDTNNFSSTIISNPHATYGKHKHNGEMDTSPTGSTASTPGGGGKSHYVPVYMTNSDHYPQRPLSAMSSPVNAPSWMRSNHGMVANGMRGAYSETESMENIHSSIHTQIQQAKALAEASRQIIAQNHHYTQSLQRSDSFKSTRSERAYPTSSSQPNTLPRTGSYTQLSPNGNGPSSPSCSHSSRSSSAFAYPMGSLPSSGVGGLKATSPYTTLLIQSKLSSSKDDDLHGSSLSLVSSSSSVYSTAEDKYAHEIRKLRRELEAAQEKVSTLTTQLSTNAHVVSAFEQSLSNMTTRLQQLTSTAEQKDNELSEMKATIDAMRIQTGIPFNPDTSGIRRQSSSASTMSKDHTSPGESVGMRRQMSAESMTSLNSMSSACSATSQNSSLHDDRKGGKKKKGSSNWLRSSFSKAFSRGKKGGKNGSLSDVEPDCGSLQADSMPNSPHMQPLSMPTTPIRGHYSGPICDSEDTVQVLHQQLQEKDRKLTDVQLEALSSASQLDSMRDVLNKMKNEMSSLKEDNERLNHILKSQGVVSSSVPTTPSTNTEPLDKRLSLGDPTKLDSIYLAPAAGSPDRDGRKITVSVFLSSTTDMCVSPSRPSELLVSSIAVSGKTKWEMLDTTVRRVFKEYCLRIDPVTNLGLSSDCVLSYHIGDQISRGKDSVAPELLPCGYLVGDSTNVAISLKGTQHNSVDALAFETLIPKSIVQRYVSLLVEHRRIILCGPSGTGKTYLAQKLAEYLVVRSGKDLNLGAIATFNVDHKSSKELRQYLANIAEQCEHSASELPSVIILDNLHHVGSLGEVFNGFLTVKVQQCPYIIGTMNQATCSTTNLQLHHNFRWVLCANHMEPVKGFLGRYLRRKLVEEEVRSGMRIPELSKIVDWIPKVWQHLNKFLETHSSSEVTVGPRLFLACPMDVEGAQVWFTDLWNYSIVPYLLEAVREGISLYGRRAPWEDPSDWIIETYPWPRSSSTDRDWPGLLPMRPEDVGYDSAGPGAAGTSGANKATVQPHSDVEGDPLMNMLMRLQEAASYSSPQSAESDSQSIDSHSSTSGANMESTL